MIKIDRDISDTLIEIIKIAAIAILGYVIIKGIIQAI